MVQRTLLATCFALSCWLVGCNDIIGIEDPSDDVLVLDEVPCEPEDVGSGASTDEGDDQDEPDAAVDEQGSTIIDAGPVSDIAQWATWPMPNPSSIEDAANPQSFYVGDVVVMDEVTRLQWQRAVEGTRTFSEALEYCEALELEGGGYRLPSRIELLSLVDFTSPGAAIDGTAFPETPASFFWSSSPFEVDGSDGAVACVVGFGPGPGFVSSADVSTKYPVRCVRDSDEADHADRTIALSEDTVVDSATTLTWQRAETGTTYTWTEASAYCGALDLDGDGWRLPTIKELHTLVDEARSDPAMNEQAFAGVAVDISYWSSSRVAGSESDAWGLNYRYGFDGPAAISSLQNVRCVR